MPDLSIIKLCGPVLTIKSFLVLDSIPSYFNSAIEAVTWSYGTGPGWPQALKSTVPLLFKHGVLEEH